MVDRLEGDRFALAVDVDRPVFVRAAPCRSCRGRGCAGNPCTVFRTSAPRLRAQGSNASRTCRTRSEPCCEGLPHVLACVLGCAAAGGVGAEGRARMCRSWSWYRHGRARGWRSSPPLITSSSQPASLMQNSGPGRFRRSSRGRVGGGSGTVRRVGAAASIAVGSSRRE